MFLINHDGYNGTICQLQMRIMMMHVYIVNRNARFIVGADYSSRESGDMWFNPLIYENNDFAATLRKNHVMPMGTLLPQNMPG